MEALGIDIGSWGVVLVGAMALAPCLVAGAVRLSGRVKRLRAQRG